MWTTASMMQWGRSFPSCWIGMQHELGRSTASYGAGAAPTWRCFTPLLLYETAPTVCWQWTRALDKYTVCAYSCKTCNEFVGSVAIATILPVSNSYHASRIHFRFHVNWMFMHWVTNFSLNPDWKKKVSMEACWRCCWLTPRLAMKTFN